MTLALIVAGLYLQAQEVKFGIKGGVNLSSLGEYEYMLNPTEDAQLENQFGAYAGLFSQIYLNNKWGLETGLFFTQLGGREKERDYDENYSVKAKASYLQLPLSVFYAIQLPGKVKLYPSIGVYGAYGLSGKIKASGQVLGTDISQQQDYFGDFAKRFDFGGTAGIQAGLGNFLLGASYDQGVIRVNKQKATWEDNAYNSNFRISVGYLF